MKVGITAQADAPHPFFNIGAACIGLLFVPVCEPSEKVGTVTDNLQKGVLYCQVQSYLFYIYFITEKLTFQRFTKIFLFPRLYCKKAHFFTTSGKPQKIGNG